MIRDLVVYTCKITQDDETIDSTTRIGQKTASFKLCMTNT